MELKPCPFCGEPPIVRYTAGYVDRLAKYHTRISIGCTSCEMLARKTVFCDGLVDVAIDCAINILVEKWNRRA